MFREESQRWRSNIKRIIAGQGHSIKETQTIATVLIIIRSESVSKELLHALSHIWFWTTLLSSWRSLVEAFCTAAHKSSSPSPKILPKAKRRFECLRQRNSLNIYNKVFASRFQTTPVDPQTVEKLSVCQFQNQHQFSHVLSKILISHSHQSHQSISD